MLEESNRFVKLDLHNVCEYLPLVVNDDGVSTKGKYALIRDGESACDVTGENDAHAMPQKREQVLNLALGRRGRWFG